MLPVRGLTGTLERTPHTALLFLAPRRIVHGHLFLNNNNGLCLSVKINLIQS